MKPKLKRKVFKGWFNPEYDIHNGKLASRIWLWKKHSTVEWRAKITVEWKVK